MSNSTASSTDEPPGAVRLSGWDYATWRSATADPMFRGPLVAVVQLAGNPGRDQVLSRVVRALPYGPLTRRLEVIDGHPYLVPAEVVPADHLIEFRASSREDLHANLAVAIAEPFPSDRPPWRILLHESGDGRTTLALVMDHAVADGRAALGLGSALFDGWEPPPDNTRQGPAIRSQVTRRSSLVENLGLARSVLRMTRVHDRPLSPLLTGRGPTQIWELIDVDPSALRHRARQNGITVNDAFVGGILTGLGAYHSARGVEVDALRVNIPISLRGADRSGGNSLAVARARLPIPGVAQGDVLADIHNSLVSWRAEPALAQSDRLAEASRLLPIGMLAAVAKTSDATISNLGPVSGGATIGGHRVERIYPLPSTMGVALSVALLTFGDVGCMGVAIDPAAVTDPSDLLDLLRSALGARPN
jgi:diacylglycerol O-acyltransferase